MQCVRTPPFAGISVNTNWAAANKDTAGKLITVYNDSMTWLYDPKNRDEAVEIFAKWVPGTDVAIGKKSIKHIHFDPRMSPNVLRAFENAEDEVLINTLKGAPRLDVPKLFRPEFMQQVEKEHPDYFADLPKL